MTSENVNNVTSTNSTNVQSENSKTLTNEEMQIIKGKGWIGPLGTGLGIIADLGWRRATRNKYGSKDVLYWMSELTCGCDFNNDGWIGVPPEAQKAGVKGRRYRANKTRHR